MDKEQRLGEKNDLSHIPLPMTCDDVYQMDNWVENKIKPTLVLLKFSIVLSNKHNCKMLVLFRRVLDDFNSQSDFTNLTEHKTFLFG